MAAGHLQFDQWTGQVFTQTSVSVQSMVPSWLKKSTGRKLDPSKYRHKGLGASSLHDTALRSCAWHIDLFDPAVLVDTEWHYAEKIYKYLRSRDAISLKTWCLFRKALPSQSSIHHTFTVNIPAGSHTTPSELVPLSKHLTLILDPATLTHLSLHNLDIRDTHLMQLLDIPCLSSLSLERSRINDDGSIFDSFMKRWGRAVTEGNAFRRLKVVVFRNFETGLHASFICFAAFPQLQFVNLDSKAVDRDTKGLKDGVVVEKKWRYSPTDGTSAKLSGKFLEKIWMRSDKTINEKMKKLYDLASIHPAIPQQGRDESEVKTLKPTTICINYGDANRYVNANHHLAPKSYSAWFVRIPSRTSDEECMSLPAKRPMIESRGTELENTARQPVKKKMKSWKKQDIGTLLGAFG